MTKSTPGFGTPLEQEASFAVEVGSLASKILLRCFSEGVKAETKAGGQLVTRADREVDEVLRAAICMRFPEDALLSEEQTSEPKAVGDGRTWVIDPLDGTRHFLGRRPEFGIHIGLLDQGRPILGAVVRPLPTSGGSLWLGIPGLGAWKCDALTGTGAAAEFRPIATSEGGSIPNVILSRSSFKKHKRAYLAALPEHSAAKSGGAGIKAAMVAEGTHQLYLAPTRHMSLWDVCAPEALVIGAGGICTDLSGEPIDYRRSDLRAHRGFVAAAPGTFQAWLPRLQAEWPRLGWPE